MTPVLKWPILVALNSLGGKLLTHATQFYGTNQIWVPKKSIYHWENNNITVPLQVAQMLVVSVPMEGLQVSVVIEVFGQVSDSPDLPGRNVNIEWDSSISEVIRWDESSSFRFHLEWKSDLDLVIAEVVKLNK